MAVVEKLLQPLNKINEFFGLLWGYLMMYLGLLVKYPNVFIADVLKTTSIGKRTGPFLDIGLGIAVVLFSYITEAVGVKQAGSYFAINLITGRALFFYCGLLLIFLGAAQLSSIIGEVVPGVPDYELFSDSYKEYTSSLKHGIISLLILTTLLIWSVDEEDGKITWTDSDSNSKIDTFLIVIFVCSLVSRWFSELEHGIVSRITTKDALTEKLRDEYQFKHARGPALLVATGLFLYMRVHSTTDDALKWLTDATLALLLAIYIVVVALERLQKANTELVIGEESGFVVTGVITTLMLIFAGRDLASKKSQESVFVALGVIMLDAMRVGYGMLRPAASAIQGRQAVAFRLLQVLVGVIAFLYIVRTDSDQHAATTPLLFGVALASALTKLLGISYISKEMFKAGSENFFRSLASTGLLLTSAYLWSHPLDDSASQTGAVLFFCLGIASRLLDSVLDFILHGGKNTSEYVAWDSERDALQSPTVDNPRTWLTLGSLIVSLAFASMAMDKEWKKIEVDGAERNDVLGDSMITLVFFIALHVLVVLLVFAERILGKGTVDLLALSRSRFIRFAVSTVVLSALAVAAGQLGFDSADPVDSAGAKSQILTSLVSYVFADAIGRELL